MTDIERQEAAEVYVPAVPYTITLEVTVSARRGGEARRIGADMLDFVIAGFGGAAGAVVKVERAG